MSVCREFDGMGINLGKQIVKCLGLISVVWRAKQMPFESVSTGIVLTNNHIPNDFFVQYIISKYSINDSTPWR